MATEGCINAIDNYTNSSSSYSFSSSASYFGLHYNENAPSERAVTAVASIACILLALVMIVGVVGNSLVILSLAIDTRKLGITSILLGSLAFTDLWITGYSVPMDIRFLIHSHFTFGSFVCVFSGFLQTFAQSSSACMLLVISCERFLVILYPLASRTMLTRRRTFILVVSCWIVSTGLAAFPATYRRVIEYPDGDGCIRVCTSDTTQTEKIMFYFYALILLYILPLGGMTIANTCVIRALIKSSRYTKKLQSMKSLEKGVKYSTASSRNGEATIVDKPIYRNNNAIVVTTCEEKSRAGESMVTSASDEDPFPPVSKVKKPKVKSGHSSVAQRQRVVVMLVSVIILYAVCWLPIFILGMLFLFFGVRVSSFGMIIFEMFGKLMCSCNSAVNPIVYGFMSKNFRQRIVHGLSRLNFWSRRKRRSSSFGSAYTLSTRGSGVSQTNRQTRYSALPTA